MSFMLLILMLFFPWLSMELVRRFRFPAFLSPVILCYGVGIFIANSGVLPEDFHLHEQISEISVLLAIPFLLYATDWHAWFQSARTVILSFLLILVSGFSVSAAAAWVFNALTPDTAQVSSMLTGLYSGGIPNINAVGKAVGAAPELLIFLNASDILTGGLYFLFLTSFAPKVYAKILPLNKTSEVENYANFPVREKLNFLDFIKGMVLTLLIAGTAAGLTLLLTGELKSVAIVLLFLTSGGVIASFFPVVRAWKGTFETGEYFILIFCVAIGLAADFSQISSTDSVYVLYMASVLFTTVALHLLLCKIFGIDRDTMLITSVAALYGPPFIAQIASVIQNRTLLFAGMATGLIGYALGNYLGLLMYFLLR